MTIFPPDWRVRLDAILAMPELPPAERFAQLATVRADGSPAVRTVVFRRFFDREHSKIHRDALVFATDARSAKVAEIRHSRAVEVCWYFRVTWEQFRLRGPIFVVTGAGDGDAASDADAADAAELADLRATLWGSMSAANRKMFAWKTPGTVKTGETPADEMALAAARLAASDAPPPPTFAVLLVAPVEVDHLRIEDAELHDRRRETRDAAGDWRRFDIHA